MNLIDALLGEHAVLYAIFDHLEQVSASPKNAEQLSAALAATGAVLVSHAKVEDDLLFPALEKQGMNGPLAVMRAEHSEVDGLVSAIPSISDLDKLKTAAASLISLARQHFLKEEQVLFQMSRQMVDDAELSRLGDQWAKMREVEIG